ncbi:tyrosine-type recombinase/integrase [Ulvibacterium sp.]|uniref:tyrosine-type recombinase/integrase n=1 Tax=Ulvibacterium sp. TaxID=2665914 RepID=UPI00262BAF37|nr:tyrosine-type recombinase/integrase [Ulvibacterium sp.]
MPLFTKGGFCKEFTFLRLSFREFNGNLKTMSERRNVKSPERETTNDHEKARDYLSDSEVKKFLEASKKTRYPKRNYLLLLMMYRHGLRVSEAIAIKKTDVNLKDSRIWINRLKGGLSTEHPISGDELRAIKRYLNSRKDNLPWLFVNERGTPLTRQAVSYVVNAVGGKVGVENMHPHVLRHSCGFYLANNGYDLRLIQDYLGHRDPKHTAQYTRVASKRFEKLWK